MHRWVQRKAAGASSAAWLLDSQALARTLMLMWTGCSATDRPPPTRSTSDLVDHDLNLVILRAARMLSRSTSRALHDMDEYSDWRNNSHPPCRPPQASARPLTCCRRTRRRQTRDPPTPLHSRPASTFCDTGAHTQLKRRSGRSSHQPWATCECPGPQLAEVRLKSKLT